MAWKGFKAIGRGALAVGTAGGSEAALYGYDKLYGDPAQQQKDAATKAIGESRALGDRMAGYYDNARQRSQGYYNRADDYANGSPEPDYIQDYYKQEKGQYGPNQVRNQYQNDSDYYYNHQTKGQNEWQATQGFYSQSPESAAYKGSMDAYGNTRTDTYDRYHALAGTETPDYLQNRYRASQNDKVDLSGLNSRTDAALAGLDNIGPSASQGLRFDPTDTQAIGSLYKGTLLPDETKKGYLEQFYEDSANGTNPYYDRLRQQTSKAMERRAAAGGTFNAGASMRQQGEALADLSAKEYQERAQMAGAAQSAHQGRLNDLTGQAKTYEDTVLGNRKFNLDVASQQDKFSLGKAGLADDLAMSGDRNYLQGQELSQNERQRLDSLAGRSSDEYMGQQRMLNDMATSSDTAERQRRGQYTDYLHQLEGEETGRVDKKFGDAMALDEQDRARRNDLTHEAETASNEEWNQKNFSRGLAGDASLEADRNQQHKFDNLMKVAAARTGIDWDHVQAAGGAMSDAEWNAIELELKRSGIDAATIASMKNDAIKVATIATKKKE